MPDAPTFGWVVQPALFETPANVAPGSWELARSILEADDETARAAMSFGFDTIWVEDHMDWVDKAHLECLTTLAWLAGRHTGLRFGTMVCGQAFRHPSYLAKAAVNLHVLTSGRFVLGIGAGNNAGEHHGFGFPFPEAAERISAMAEQIRLMRALWKGDRTHIAGDRWTIDGAILAPAPQPPIPVMVGGGGEKLTLRVVAELADWWCSDIGRPETFRHKSAVLDRHCEAIDRDPAEILRSQVVWISLAEDKSRLVTIPGLPIIAGSATRVIDELCTFREAGVQHFQVRFMDFPERAGMERFAAEVMPRVIA